MAIQTHTMRAKPLETPATITQDQIPVYLDQYDVLGVVTPEYNCCVQKVIGEMSPYLKEHKVAPVMTYDHDIRKLVDSLPEWILYLRTGAKIGENIQDLALCESMIGFWRSLMLPVYYYLDDALFMVNNMAPLKLMWACDKVIVATDALAEFVISDQKIPKPVYLLRTHMDFPQFDACPVPMYLLDKSRFNILFTSQGRVGALWMRRILERMNQTPDRYKNVNLVVVSAWVGEMRTILNEFRGIKKTYWEWMPLQEHYGLVKGCQLVLAPGEEEDLRGQVDEEIWKLWLHSKSCVKYNIAGAARIPIISSPLQEYELAIKHKQTGFIARTLDEWIEYIDYCLANPDVCREIGKVARKDVEDNFHVYNRAKQFAEIFRGSTECLVEGVDSGQPQSDPVYPKLQLCPVPETVPRQCASTAVPES